MIISLHLHRNGCRNDQFLALKILRFTNAFNKPLTRRTCNYRGQMTENFHSHGNTLLNLQFNELRRTYVMYRGSFDPVV